MSCKRFLILLAGEARGGQQLIFKHLLSLNIIENIKHQ